MVKIRCYSYTDSGDSEGSEFGSFSKNKWYLSSEEENEDETEIEKLLRSLTNHNNSSKIRDCEFSSEVSEDEISEKSTIVQNKNTKKTKNMKAQKLKKNQKKNKKEGDKEETKQNEEKSDELFRKRKRLTIIFAHGNGESIYELERFALRIAHQTNCNVYLFEYPGYPQTKGKRRERNCYRSAEAVYKWVINKKRVPAEEILWFGHSLGTAVALEIASKHPCGGVLLMSPILSIFRVVVKLVCNAPFDMFVNLKKAPKMEKPVMVLHGTDDTIVSVNHGKKLYELFPNKFDGVWIKHAGHNNIESKFRKKFYFEFNRFIDHLVSKLPQQKETKTVNYNLTEKNFHSKDPIKRIKKKMFKN